MRSLLALLMCASMPAALCAQDKKDKKPGDEMIEKYLAAETDKLSAKFLDGAKTIDEWQAKRPRLYQEYMDMLGLWPIPEKTPLKATKTGEVEAHGVVVEKLHFQSKPGLYVTANLYRPMRDANAKRRPAILYVCGHSGKGRDGNKTAFQDHGFWFANHGYVCIVLDTLQLGEIPGVHHGTYGRPWGHLTSWGVKDAEKMKNHNRFWWHDLGYSPAAVECWNGVRAIDYLVTRDDVDPDRIGVTGISGGGAATFWIAAADERVKVAVPVSGMADLEYYVKNKGVNSHCDCMFLYNTYQWDWTTIAALVAPRPMLFANSDKDPIFPMDANRRIYAKLQKIYGMYGMEKAVGEYVSAGGHDYRPDLRKAIFHFFNLHLKRQPTPLVEDSAKYTPLEGKKLRVFPTDDDLPKDAINHKIDELFIPPAKVALPEKGKFAEWKKKAVTTLQHTTFRSTTSRVPKASEIQAEFNSAAGTLLGWHSWFTSERGIQVVSYERWKNANKTRYVLLIRSPGETTGNPEWSQPYFDEAKELFAIAPRGTHSSAWTQKSPPNYVERSHLLLGYTVDEGRVVDVLSAVRRFSRVSKEPIPVTIVAKGEGGILAAYAALFEPSIKEVVVIDPPKSHKEGPHFLNVMRVLDIPEALGLLAPTPLTIIGGDAKAFERTAEIYRLAGAAEKLTRK
jgi:cephalosporin-C deacetylase-like acetyl esterase